MEVCAITLVSLDNETGKFGYNKMSGMMENVLRLTHLAAEELGTTDAGLLESHFLKDKSEK